jgi:hypothetical protein
MAVRSARREFVSLIPDTNNRNPYRGLPSDYPSAHSRFPIVPPKEIGDLSFVPPVSENGPTEGVKTEMTREARAAWDAAMEHAIGDLITDNDSNPDDKTD